MAESGTAVARRLEATRVPSCVVLVEARYRAQAQPAGLIAALERHGHRVSVIDPDEATHEITGASWCDAFDVVVARGRSHSLLLKLKWAEFGGARTINRRASIDAVRDKAEMTVALAAAALPIPPSFAGSLGQAAEAEAAFRGIRQGKRQLQPDKAFGTTNRCT